MTTSGPPLRAEPPGSAGAGRDLAIAVLLPALVVALIVALAAGVITGSATLAAVLAVIAGALWALLRMPWYARRRAAGVEAYRLREPWRGWVEEAQRAKQRFDAAVAGVPAGPVADRLRDIAARVDAAVRESWRIAQRGQELEDGLGRLPASAQLQQQLAAAQDAADQPRASALSNQLEARERLESAAAQARLRLQELDARLDEAVARAVELSLDTGDAVQLGGVSEDVGDLVTDLEALRRGLEEVRGLSPGGTSAPGTPGVTPGATPGVGDGSTEQRGRPRGGAGP